MLSMCLIFDSRNDQQIQSAVKRFDKSVDFVFAGCLYFFKEAPFQMEYNLKLIYKKIEILHNTRTARFLVKLCSTKTKCSGAKH